MSDAAAVLDDPEARARLDPGGMGAAVHGLPEQCRDAWEESRRLELPPPYSEIDRVVILGVGGSAIAGDIFRALLARESAVPVLNHRQYGLPPYVDERTLLIASSFSGDTEETLSAFEQGLATPSKKLVLTTGGRLLTAARANGVPAFAFQFRGEPRAAIGYGLMPLLAVAEAAGLMQSPGKDVDEAVAAMQSLRARIGADVPLTENAAKRLAARLAGRLPVIYGGGVLAEAARRWKTQLNESAKVWAFHEQLPEASHNAIVAYGLPPEAARLAFVVFLRSPRLHPRLALQYEFSRRAMAEAGVEHAESLAEGTSALAEAMTSVLMGDYVSYYLALLNGVDPTPTTVIDNLKAWLARQE